MPPEETKNEILAAIGALDEKFDRKFDELKKVDSDLIEKVQRIDRRQERMDQDIRDLKSDTARRFEDESHAAKTTMEAIVKHVDESAKAFTEKAADIDALKKDVGEVKALNVEQNESLKTIAKHFTGILSNPRVKQLGAVVISLLIAWLTAKTQGYLK